MKKLFVITAFIVILAVSFTSFGCLSDRWVEVEGGDYVPLDTPDINDSPAAGLVSSMYIDRNTNTLELKLQNGLIIKQSFSARQKQDWPSGCPTNIGSTKMEVLDLEDKELVIGDITIHNPVLVRNCPEDPVRVILREDGQIGDAGTAFSEDAISIRFKPYIPAGLLHGPRILSEDEKDLAERIALNSLELKGYLEKNGTFETELEWLARLCDKSGSCTGWQIDYNWEDDARFKAVPEDAVWYPAVVVRFSGSNNSIVVAVDMEKENVVYIQGPPDLTDVTAPVAGIPNITGWISDIQATSGNDTAGQILVELDKSDGTSDKYWVTALNDTLITDYSGGTQDRVAFSGLEVGQQVQVWFGGPVRESYPAQVDAAQIDIVLNEEFAIYLLDEKIDPLKIQILSHIELPESPILSTKDIISYSKTTHEIRLTPEAYQRIRELVVPRAFAVAVHRAPVYTGVFWTPASSMSFDGVVILKQLSEETTTIKIELGYPSPFAFTGEDPRSDELVLKSLARIDRLVD